MAEFQPPGWQQNAGNTHSAAELRNYIQSLLGGRSAAQALITRGGVNPSLGNSMVVTQTGSPSMAVIVRSGHGWVPGTEAGTQGAYAVVNDSDVTLAVTAAHATLARIDIVCFKVQDSVYSGVTNSCSLVVVAGTPSGSPTAPAAPANSITLAQIAVGASVTQILNANITDTRTWIAGVGGIVPVATQTERDALVGLYDGFTVWQRDVDLQYVYNGTEFIPMPGSETGVGQQATTSGTDSTSLTTYANMAGTGAVTSFSFTKRANTTRLRVDMSGTFFGSNTASGASWAVNINSVDYEIARLASTIPAGAARLTIAGTRFISGINAGTYTIQGRHKVQAGAGTISRDVGDWLSIACKEIL